MIPVVKTSGGKGQVSPRSARKRDNVDVRSQGYEFSTASPSPTQDMQIDYMESESTNAADKSEVDESQPLIPDKWYLIILIMLFHTECGKQMFRPGKVCALCALGEKSTLGQGELLQINISAGFDVEIAKIVVPPEEEPCSLKRSLSTSAATLPAVSQRRQMKFR